MKWLDLVKIVAPMIVTLTVPKGGILGPLIAEAIIDAEQIPDASGPEKKAHVMDLVATSVAIVNEAKGVAVLDPAAVATSASAAIDLTISILNQIHKRALALPPTA